jgi:ADP-ribose pyrophosphatase
MVLREEKMSSRYAVILVKGDNDTYLMGTRKDNGKINFPAGGIKNGEDPKVGAERELREETGFSGKNFKLVGVYKKKDKQDKPIIVYVFTAEIEGKPSLEKDPDMEFRSIYWKNPFSIPSEDLHIKPSENSGIKTLIELMKK